MSLLDAALSLASALASLLALALLPKCPLCLAALLSAVGLGVAVSAWLAPLAQPLLLAGFVVALVLGASARIRKRRACPGHRCDSP